jgi:SAM-dependent methyltransferase
MSNLVRRTYRNRFAYRHRVALRRLPQAVRLLGWTYRCSCCEWTFRRLLRFKTRANVKCPLCGSLERHRQLALYLRMRTSIFDRPLDVLHFAPEDGIRRVLARSRARTISVDLNHPMADRHMDIRALDFPDETFDLVLCSHVLEHVQEDSRAMAELHRVIRPGGILLVMVPYNSSLPRTREDPSVRDPAERTRLFGQSDHVRYYGRDLVDRLRAAGFEVSEDRFGSSLAPAVVAKHVLSRDPIFRCERPRQSAAARVAATTV